MTLMTAAAPPGPSLEPTDFAPVDGFSRWELLLQLLTEVVERYEPQAARVLRGEATTEPRHFNIICRCPLRASVLRAGGSG